MTLMGAIKQLHELRSAEDMPFYYKPAIAEVINVLLMDAQEARHGHWTSSQGLAEVGEVQCSNCKTIYYAGDLYIVGETDENGIGQALMPNYCPHCGAKMDRVKNETN